MIGTAKIIGHQLYLSDRINPRRERSRLFREIFKTPFLSGFLPSWLVDSGAIVTFETALQRRSGFCLSRRPPFAGNSAVAKFAPEYSKCNA